MIDCCRYCVAPKRHVGCHSECKEYIEQKRIHEKKRLEELERKRMINDIDSSHFDYIYKKKKRQHLHTKGRIYPWGYMR